MIFTSWILWNYFWIIIGQITISLICRCSYSLTVYILLFHFVFNNILQVVQSECEFYALTWSEIYGGFEVLLKEGSDPLMICEEELVADIGWGLLLNQYLQIIKQIFVYRLWKYWDVLVIADRAMGRDRGIEGTDGILGMVCTSCSCCSDLCHVGWARMAGRLIFNKN